MPRLRHLLPLLLTAAATVGPGSASAASWAPDVQAARAYAATRTGDVTFRVADLQSGRSWSHRSWVRVNGASTLKTLMMATYLRRGDVRHRPLRPDERDLLRPMIRASANRPANHLAVTLGEAALNRTAKAAGMGTISLRLPYWGQTLTSARAQVALMLSLPRLFPPRHRDYAMGLLATIQPSQRWGIGQVQLPGWQLYFKGGWGSGSGAVDHQAALLVKGERRIAVAIMTTANASHADGRATLKGVATRLLRGL